ncbi:MAG TPA: amidohydrolase family protein [Burkholderiales bacterium]|jgi:cytosine/adenosine deaminase-related metal-dependent hydrolase
MNVPTLNRRTTLKLALGLAAAGMAPVRLFAQTSSASRAAKPLPARGEFLIRGATVLTMDAKLGDFERGDVHVRNGAIVAVAPSLAASGVEALDGRGMICMPGFIDTHWHLWTTACRPIIRIDDPKRGYFPVTSALGRHFTPEDSYRSVRLGLAEALSAGATTVHNWAHNVRTPAHADAELRAMRDTGVRGRFSYGQAQGMPDDQPMNYDDVAKVKRDWLPNDGMLTLGMCSRNFGPSQTALRGTISLDMARKDWGGARALGLPITLHTSGPSPIKALDEAKLLGPDVQLVHPLLTSAEDRRILHERGASYSMAPIGESRRPASAGVIQLGELLEAGVKVSLSIDTTGTYGCDYFEAMRILYNLHQHRIGERVRLTAKRLVQLATLDGAVDLGIAERAGSLTPGKRADLILVRTGDVNIAPIGDPYEALISFGQPRNVDTVIVDGRVLRRGGEFTALDYAEVLKEASETASALRARANWT